MCFVGRMLQTESETSCKLTAIKAYMCEFDYTKKKEALNYIIARGRHFSCHLCESCGQPALLYNRDTAL